MGLLQSGRIDGTEFKEGNRAGRPENRALVLGPDFGGAINEPKYLPAYWRYSGRTYQASRDDWTTFSNFPESLRPSILIMSGLYGLIPFDEYIQNYDCHITDTDLQTGQPVLKYWGSTLTDILLSHCDRLESEGMKVGPIIDLLSEKSYQEAIDWQRVYSQQSVLHRVFQKKSDREALVNMGIFLRTLLREPMKASRLVPDQFFDEPEFLEPDRIAFERKLGASPLAVARA
jgi:Peroxide stress protein YaaA